MQLMIVNSVMELHLNEFRCKRLEQVWMVVHLFPAARVRH